MKQMCKLIIFTLVALIGGQSIAQAQMMKPILSIIEKGIESIEGPKMKSSERAIHHIPIDPQTSKKFDMMELNHQNTDRMDFSRNLSTTPTGQLFLAVSEGNFVAMQELLKTEDINTSTYVWIENNKLVGIRKYSSASARKKITLLATAVRLGQIEVVNYLLERGADVNKTDDNDSYTAPLYFAAQINNLDMVILLVNHGACADQKILDHALKIAVDKGNGDMAEYLMDHGADVNSERFIDPLLHVAVRQENLNLIQSLVRHGASIDGNALVDAAERGNLEIVDYLVTHGANVNMEGSFGETALVAAVESGRQDMVEYLLQHGADINATAKYARTALHKAAEKGDVDMVNFLVKHGAKVNAKDEWDNTPFCYASGNETRDYLVKCGANLNVLHKVASNGNIEGVAYLLNHGAKINAKDKEGKTPLHYVAYGGTRLEMMQYLVEHGAKINAKDNFGKTPLHYQAVCSFPVYISEMVELGADVNAQDKQGNTPLHNVILEMGSYMLEDCRLVEEFVRNGADVTLKNNEGKTPRDLAIEYKMYKIARYLESLNK